MSRVRGARASRVQTSEGAGVRRSGTIQVRNPGTSRVRQVGINLVKGRGWILAQAPRSSRARWSRAIRSRARPLGRVGGDRTVQLRRRPAERLGRCRWGARSRLPRSLRRPPANGNPRRRRGHPPPAVPWAMGPLRPPHATRNRRVHHPRPPATGSAPHRRSAARAAPPSLRQRAQRPLQVPPPQRTGPPQRLLLIPPPQRTGPPQPPSRSPRPSGPARRPDAGRPGLLTAGGLARRPRPPARWTPSGRVERPAAPPLACPPARCPSRPSGATSSPAPVPPTSGWCTGWPWGAVDGTARGGCAEAGGARGIQCRRSKASGCPAGWPRTAARGCRVGRRRGGLHRRLAAQPAAGPAPAGGPAGIPAG